MRTPKQTDAVDPDELVANPWNPNVMSPENEAKLDHALKRFGFFKPIVVREIKEGGRKVYQILGGEHRWGSAKRLGFTSVPIFNLGEIDDGRAKEIALADNARYGFDDASLLADVLKDLGDTKDLQDFLPYSDSDVRAIFDASHIALDELDLDEKFETKENPEPIQPKAPKTHALMRFKVPLKDAEKITDLISRTMKRHGLTSGDELTNAGDALVQLLISEPDGE